MEVETAVQLGAWQPCEWKDGATPAALVDCFISLGLGDAVPGILEGFTGAPTSRLLAIIKATGNTEMSQDVNYVWTSAGRIALMLDTGRNDPEHAPAVLCGCAGCATYDMPLRAWVVDLGALHAKVCDDLRAMAEELRPIDEELRKKYEEDIEAIKAENMCDGGDWANGVSLQPYPKFALVTAWVRRYCASIYEDANEIVFWKRPGTKAPPFVQVKVHRTCFFFKGRAGPGSVIVNPEFAKPGLNELREDLGAEVHGAMQLAVEIIGGKSQAFPGGLSGKLTVMAGRLLVLPMAPARVARFDPHAADYESDAGNSYLAFRNSHPSLQ
jgi:hypothetical protein